MKIQKTNFDKGTNITNCAKCGLPVGLNREYTSQGQIIGIGWFDPYVTGIRFHKSRKGAQVHHECLSDKRKKEIEQELGKLH